MIKLLSIKKIHPDTYSVVIDKHGTELHFHVKVERTTLAGKPLRIYQTPSELEAPFLEYALQPEPGRPRGVLVIPLVEKTMQLIKEIDKGKKYEFPIVLHPD